MINACSTVCLIEIKIERHPMQIIATDGENVEPNWVDTIVMSSGNSYISFFSLQDHKIY